jgi:hypothetical protein
MFGFTNKKAVENEMSEWLSHPNEFGEVPKLVKFKRTYKGELIAYGKVKIHLVEYEMADGRVGRGFVNAELTWSFLGDAINTISDEELLVAYCGWAWLFPMLQMGEILTDFDSEKEETLLVEQLKEEGFVDILLGDRFQIGTSELFEFTASQDGKAFVGAGDSNAKVLFTESEPAAALPSIYFLLGQQVIQAMR